MQPAKAMGKVISMNQLLIQHEKLMSFWVAIIPLLIVMVLNFVFTKTSLSVSHWYAPELLQETIKFKT